MPAAGQVGLGRQQKMATANRRWSRSLPANRERSCSPPPTESSLFFPPELIPEVAKLLTNLQDFFALRAACRAYRALLPLTASNLASQAPLLLFIPHDRTQSHALFHLTLRRIHHRFRLPRASIPDADHIPIATESHTLGCRLAINNNNYYYCRLPKRDLSIIHLLTGEQVCLPNPRAAISSLLLFGGLVVATSSDDILYCRDSIQYCRLGAPRWRVATLSFPNELGDLIFVKGTLYALVNPGYRLAVVELPDDNSNNLKLEFLGPQFDTQEHDKSVFCLAECCGELLLVIRARGERRFQVLQLQAGEGKWLRITSLGGCTLFFAESYFSGCLGPDHPGIQGDCIYMTGLMMCVVLSLIDQSPVDALFVNDPKRAISDYCSTPLWVFPSMC